MAFGEEFLKKNVNEFFTKNFWRDVVCELVATFFLVSVQSAAAVTWTNPDPDSIHVLEYALATGFTVTILNEAFLPLGGAHMNPALSIGFALAGKITPVRVFLYLVAQCGGAMAGAAFTDGVTPSEQKGDLGSLRLHPGITSGQGMVVEAWLTFMLMQTIWGSINSKRKRVLVPSLLIGLAYAVTTIAGFRYTGAGMNPARALGPAVVINIWNHHWIYWVGPIFGAAVATIVFRLILNNIDTSELPDDYERNELRLVLKESNGRNGRRPSFGRYQQIYGLSTASLTTS